MPVIGEPTPFHSKLLVPRPNAVVREAIETLATLFPPPRSYITWYAFNMRKRRLGVELAEFDLLHRLRRGRPADLDTLCDVGEAIILPDADRFPAKSLPLDSPLLVNPKSYYCLIRVSDAASAERQRERSRRRRARRSGKKGDTP